jgi:hypothetical protein
MNQLKKDSETDREDTIFGDTPKTDKNKVQVAASAVDGKIGKRRLNSGTKLLKEGSLISEEAKGEPCICKNLCKRKYFNLYLKMKEEFKKHAELFE